MTQRIIISIVCAIVAVSAMAQTGTQDGIKVKELGEVVVNAQMPLAPNYYGDAIVYSIGQRSFKQNSLTN